MRFAIDPIGCTGVLGCRALILYSGPYIKALSGICLDDRYGFIRHEERAACLPILETADADLYETQSHKCFSNYHEPLKSEPSFR